MAERLGVPTLIPQPEVSGCFAENELLGTKSRSRSVYALTIELLSETVTPQTCVQPAGHLTARSHQTFLPGPSTRCTGTAVPHAPGHGASWEEQQCWVRQRGVLLAERASAWVPGAPAVQDDGWGCLCRAGGAGLVCFLQPMPFSPALLFPWPWLKQLNRHRVCLSFPNTALLRDSAFLCSGGKPLLALLMDFCF